MISNYLHSFNSYKLSAVSIFKTRLGWFLTMLLFCFVLMVPVRILADPSISQSYISSTPLSLGTLVSLVSNTTDHVTASTSATTNQILGVVVDSSNTPIELSYSANNQVQIATSGVEQVLVSDINGKIVPGDSITASPISGVGMKATQNSKIIGLAQDNFPNSTKSTQSAIGKNGNKVTVQVGEVPVLVNVSYFYKQPDKTILPQSIQNLADSLAGKKVNTLPIIISMGIFFFTLIVIVSIIYSMIRNSIISVGRNPMSQAAVYRNVIQLSVLVILILVAAIFAISLVLSKF